MNNKLGLNGENRTFIQKMDKELLERRKQDGFTMKLDLVFR